MLSVKYFPLLVFVGLAVSACGQGTSPTNSGDVQSKDGTATSQGSVPFQAYSLADLPELMKTNPIIREHFSHNPERLAQLMAESMKIDRKIVSQQTTPVAGLNCFLSHEIDDEGSTIWARTELYPCPVAITSGSTYFSIQGAGKSNSNFVSYNSPLESGLNVPLLDTPTGRPIFNICRGGSAEVSIGTTLYVANVPNFCVNL